MNLDKVVVQSDAMNVVNSIYAIKYLAVLDPIMIDCRLLLNSFKKFLIIFLVGSSMLTLITWSSSEKG